MKRVHDVDAPDYIYRMQRNRYRRLRAAGICVWCGQKPAVMGKNGPGSYCKKHKGDHHALVVLRQVRLRHHGLCRQCGAAPEGRCKGYCDVCRQRVMGTMPISKCCDCGKARKRLTGLVRDRCAKCAEKYAAKAPERKRKASLVRLNGLVTTGRCQACGKARGKTGTTRYCRPCADEHSRAEVRRQTRVREQGLCVRCSDPRGYDGTTCFCRSCADKAHPARRTA